MEPSQARLDPFGGRRGLGAAVLSLWIFWHLAGVILYPNSQSYLGNRFGEIFAPYVKFLGLAANWRFFAPEPGPPPLFVEYELTNAQGEVLFKGRMPEFKDPFFLHDRQNRRLASVMFMSQSPARIEKMLVPYLCGSHPGTKSVRVSILSYPIPDLTDVASGKKKVQIQEEVGFDRKEISTDLCALAAVEEPSS